MTFTAGGAFDVNATGAVTIDSSGGTIGVGTDAVAQAINVGTGAAARTITIGNSTGATSVVLDVGTGNLDLGVTATAHTVRIGSTTGASALTLQAGSGNINATAAVTTTDGIASGTAKRVGGVASSSSAASAAITGTTETEANFDISYAMPANSVRVGSMMKLHGAGIHTATTGAETHDSLVKWGSVTLASVTGIDPADNDVFMWDLTVSVRSIGAGAGGSTVVGSGYFSAGAANRAATATGTIAGNVESVFFGSAGTSTAAVQTDASQTLAIAIDRQAAATDADSARLDQFIVEIWY